MGLTALKAAMESEIGFPIFERTAFGVTLTPQGEVFYRQTQGIPQIYENAVSSARNSEREKQMIRISIFSYLRKYVTRACEKIKAQNEEIDFSFVSCRILESDSALINHRADIAPLTVIQDADERLFGLPIFRCCNSVIVPDTHPLAVKKSVRAEELDGQSILLSAKAPDSRNMQSMKRLLKEKCPHSLFVEYQHPDQADALCQINGYPIVSLSFLEMSGGYRSITICDSPTVLIGAACRKEDMRKYLALMESFRDQFIRCDDFMKNTEREK